MNLFKRTLPPAASPIYFRDIINGVKGLFRGRKEVNRFETELKEYFAIKHCFTVSSGKAALTLILQAIKEQNPERDSVLIPAYICYSVPSAIKRAGLKIILCDIHTDTLDYDPIELDKLLSNQYPERKIDHDRLLAVITPHLFGIPSDIERLKTIIDNEKVCIIEDAAQSMGSEVKSRKLGTIGDVGFFSLGRGKAISTVEGGIIITKDTALAGTLKNRIEKINNYSFIEQLTLLAYSFVLMILLRPSFFWLPKALPFLKLGQTEYNIDFKIKKLSSFQAGLAKTWQTKLKQMMKTRSQNVAICHTMLKHLTNLSNHFLSSILIKSEYPLLRFPILMNKKFERDTIINMSEKNGLGLMSTYPDIVLNIPELKEELSSSKLSYQGAKAAVDRILTLPVHEFVKKKDMQNIFRLFINLNIE